MEELKDILLTIENIDATEHEKNIAILKLGNYHYYDAIPYLIAMMQDEKHSFHLKRAMASSLSELTANEAVPYIFSQINTPENANFVGTLMYALLRLDCIEYFLIFVEYGCVGNFECRQMAYSMVEKYADRISAEMRNMALLELANYMKIFESGMSDFDELQDRIDFAQGAMELLNIEFYL